MFLFTTIPLNWKRYQLSQLINKALSLPKPIPFDFLVHGAILRATLGECRADNGINEEDTVEIEYFESVLPPQRMTTLPHEHWVSSISYRISPLQPNALSSRHFLPASYNGHVRLFGYVQQSVRDVSAHRAAITSVCVVPSLASKDDYVLILSASHDLTGSLTHKVGPTSELVPSDRKKRAKIASEADRGRGRRKAPTILRSHTARVSKAHFTPGSNERAYSRGFDSMAVPERPMLDLVVTLDGYTVLAFSTDWTVSVFYIRLPSLASTAGKLMHPATPSCLVYPSAASTFSLNANANDTPTPSAPQVLTGAYDRIARLWDLRSLKSAVTNVKAWDGTPKKILSIDWVGEVVGVGGEGGVEIWQISWGDRDRVLTRRNVGTTHPV
ncbi:hypothetical protein J3R83DRAFT_13308 [Lanmaoa asiatica]|nr:hypothetical protein J3R83DRAFT_13308 [Lanmaoa asiatica]